MSALENRFPFVDRTSQTRDTVENIWTNFNSNILSYNASLLAKNVTVAYFRYGRSLIVGESGWVRCASLVPFVHSYVHGRALPTILTFCVGLKCEDMAQLCISQQCP